MNAEKRLSFSTREAADRAGLLVLLGLVPLRAMMRETHTFEIPRWFRNLVDPLAVYPGTTLSVVLLILGVAVWVLFSRLWWGGRGYRRTGAEAGATVLLIAAVISTWHAGQKHLALVGVLDFLGLILYMLTLRQLLVKAWHIRLATAVVLGSGAMVVAKCGVQRWVEFPDTIAYYEEHKDELIRDEPGSAGGSQTSGFMHDYEQRLRSQLVTGYFSHSNVLGSYLVLIVMTAVGVATSRFGRRPAWTLVVPLLIGAAAIAALLGAQSKGALVACAVSFVVWASVLGSSILRRRAVMRASASAVASLLRKMRKRLWWIVWVGALAATLALVGVLKARPDALGRSMQFRSMYWQGAWDMVIEQGPWGVGANNFGRHFTRYKSVACPEEVESPHSWGVRSVAEWGVLGLAGMLLLFLGLSRRLLRDATGGGISLDTKEEAPGNRGVIATGSIILWTAGIGAVFAGWLAWKAADPGSNAYAAMFALEVAALPWVFGFVGSAVEHRHRATFFDDAPGPLLAGLLAGLLGFLLHTGIDLAMFHPGAATTFFALVAVALAVRDRSDRAAPGSGEGGVVPARVAAGQRTNLRVLQARHPRRRVVALLFGIVGLAIVSMGGAWLARPAATLGEHLESARSNVQTVPWSQYVASAGGQAYTDAIDCYPFDGTAIEEQADELIQRVSSVEQADFLLGLLKLFRDRDPQNAIAWHQLATVSYRRFMLGGDPADLDRAIDFTREAVAAYPTSPTKRLMLAELLERRADLTGSAEARQAVVAELEQALSLDAGRVFVSKPHRFTEEMRRTLEARMDRFRDSGVEGPGLSDG